MATPGSIPAALDMFRSEVRFYREVAPHLDVRVPACFESHDDPVAGTRLVLEDLGEWRQGADPRAHARVLRSLHDAWTDVAIDRWPWLRRPGTAAELIGAAYDRTWPSINARRDLTEPVRELARSMVGTVAQLEVDEGGAGPWTLVHGDASWRNVFTSPDGEIALVDWEDVRAAPGVTDLAWLLISSVEPDEWTSVVDAYGDAPGLNVVLRTNAAQGLFMLSDLPDGSPEAAACVRRLEAAARRLD